MKDEEKITSYYNDKLTSFGPGAQGVGWKNDLTQKNRFRQLLRIVTVNAGFSINDLGCGTGDLLPFLQQNEFIDFVYRGYDALDTMIAHHEEAVVMSLPALEKAQHPELKQMASAIISEQEKEIAEMKRWRNNWFPGAPPAINMEMPGMSSSRGEQSRSSTK